MPPSHITIFALVSKFLYQCPIYPDTNYRTACDLSQDNYDFIVVGAGSAGPAVAYRLSENPDWNVLLIEAGGIPTNLTETPSAFYLLQGTKEDWQYKTEPGNHCKGIRGGRCRWPLGKVLGGGSSINGMLRVKGSDRDYNNWAKMGNPGWDWKSMQPYFDKMDKEMVSIKWHSEQLARKLIQESASLLGMKLNPINPLEWLGYFDFHLSIKDNRRFSTAKGFIVNARNRKNLCVLKNTEVTKILIHEKGTHNDNKQPKAYGVKLDNGQEKYARKEVILSAGPINTPKLMMLSGIGPKKHLESLNIPVIRNLPVGQNLQDHMMMFGVFIEFPANITIVNSTGQFDRYCYHIDGPASTADYNTIGFINTLNNSLYPDIQTIFTYGKRSDRFSIPVILYKSAFNQESIDSLVEINNRGDLIEAFIILLNPKSRGQVTLKSKNPKDKPIINAGYMTDEKDEDMETMLRGIKHIEDLVAQEPFAKVKAKLADFYIPNCKDLEFNTREYWKCNLRNFATSVYHPAGTCKMGPSSDPSAVVSPKLKVYGVDGLRVIDSSIMPLIVSANTMIPSIAIGERGASFIIDEYSK